MELCRRQPSLLLSNIHRTLSAIAKIYDGGISSTTASATHPVMGRLPADPADEVEGRAVLKFFCEELHMGVPAVDAWRARLAQAVDRRWGAAVPDSGGDDDASAPWKRPECVAHIRPSISDELLRAAAGSRPSSNGPAAESRLWFRPREQDALLINWSRQHLHLQVSPFVTLSPPGTASAASAAPPQQLPRPLQHAQSSTFYATRRIPAGMILMSLPTDAVLFSEPPQAADPILSYFMHVEDLVGQLVAADEDASSPHYEYVQYLKDSIVPPRNLPFLSQSDMHALLTKKDAMAVPAPAASSSQATIEQSATVSDSPAEELWQFFNEDMKRQPLSPYLRDRLSSDDYAWWTSCVLSRREGTSSLIPIVDKLNHSPLPNCYYTMSSTDTVCGIDVLDNIMAGVPLRFLYQPYVHVFAIRDIHPGEELTLSYASAPDGLYRPSSHVQPPPLDTMPPQQADSSGSSSTREEVQDVLQSLFPMEAAGDHQLGVRQMLHPGQHHVKTVEGAASWTLQWGFVPPCDSVFSAADLREMGALVAERRVESRTVQFPISKT